MGVKIEKDNSLTISGFEGIGQSVLSDFSDMMGVNTEIPGVVGANFKFNKISETLTPRTFTVDGAGVTSNIITTSGTLWYRGNVLGLAVTLSTTDTLPAPLAINTVYYVINSGTSTGLYRLATTLENATAGTAIDITDTGTGTHTITPITPGKIVSWTKNPSGDIFFIANSRSDEDSYVWFLDNIGSVPYLLAGRSATIASGIVYYKGYILVFHSNGIDALANIQSYDDTLTWTNNFDGVAISTSPNAMPFLSVNDDAIYFYNGAVSGRYYQIGLLEEVAGGTFAPGTGSTFSCVVDALTIPFEGYDGQPVDIDEINEYIVVASGNDKLYFWDKKSPSFTTFIKIQESGIKGIEVIDNLIYIFMTRSGNIYQSNTTSSGLLLSIPEHITKEYYNYIAGVDNYLTNYSFVFKRELLFSISIVTSAGVYNYLMSYNLDTKQLLKKNISSYGEVSEISGATYGTIYSVYNQGENLLLSSSDYTVDGDILNYSLESQEYNATYNGTRSKYVYDGNEPYIITGLIPLGDVYNKKTLRTIHISLARALATGQGITISYRRDDNSSWTALKTVDYATNGAIKDIKVEAPITDIIDLQIKINLDGLNLTSPLLKSVRLIP